MKLIFLNIWDFQQESLLREFIKYHQPTTDIFCFQEAYAHAIPLLEALFPEWPHAYANKTIGKVENFYQATYTSPGLAAPQFTTILNDTPHIGLAIHTHVPTPLGIIHVANMHGISRPIEKNDNPARLEQSAQLIKYFAALPGKVIIGGDFNLNPQTRSVRQFSEAGYRDLIQEYAIPTTRNHLAWDRFPVKMLYSDYVFTTPDINITSFSVPDCDVSDHLPLLLEIS